jgi:hypothetical protein
MKVQWQVTLAEATRNNDRSPEFVGLVRRLSRSIEYLSDRLGSDRRDTAGEIRAALKILDRAKVVEEVKEAESILKAESS